MSRYLIAEMGISIVGPLVLVSPPYWASIFNYCRFFFHQERCLSVEFHSKFRIGVDNILMPIITFFIPGGSWQTATVTIGPIVITWGKFLADLIYFIIMAFAVFLIAKKVLKEDKVEKK